MGRGEKPTKPTPKNSPEAESEDADQGHMRIRRWEKALDMALRNKRDLYGLQKETNMEVELAKKVVDRLVSAPSDLKKLLNPVFKYSFVQWLVYDAMREADEEKAKQSLWEIMRTEDFQSDVLCFHKKKDTKGLENAGLAPEWMWHLMHEVKREKGDEKPTPGMLEIMLAEAKKEKKDGIAAFKEERYGEAYASFATGLHLAAPAVSGTAHHKVRADLHKNQAMAALKLEMPHCALAAAESALQLDDRDEKAWYRKAEALKLLGKEKEAVDAMCRAGMPPPVEEKAPEEPHFFVSRENELPHWAKWTEEPIPKWTGDEIREAQKIQFLEVGMDSVATIDFLRHLGAGLPGLNIPKTLVFEYPEMGLLIDRLAGLLNAPKDEDVKWRLSGLVYRSARKALGGRCPIREGKSKTEALSEEDALAAVEELRQAYESADYQDAVRRLAKRNDFELRSFTVNLRPLALQYQAPVLERRGLPPTADGMRRLESSIMKAPLEKGTLTKNIWELREVFYGGVNGMWAMNMEGDEHDIIGDCDAMQARRDFMLADPFGANRVNTNAAGYAARSA